MVRIACYLCNVVACLSHLPALKTCGQLRHVVPRRGAGHTLPAVGARIGAVLPAGEHGSSALDLDPQQSVALDGGGLGLSGSQDRGER